MTLPDNIVPGHTFHPHYSLKPKLREQQPLRDEVAALPACPLPRQAAQGHVSIFSGLPSGPSMATAPSAWVSSCNEIAFYALAQCARQGH